MSIEVLISCNSFCYDVTINLNQHHVIKRVTVCHGHMPDAINLLMYFVVVTLLFKLLAKHSSAALPC